MDDPQAVRKHIANMIRTRRLALRLDQNTLSARSGISQAALSRYEAAAASMRAEDVPRLAKALGIEPLDFYLDNVHIYIQPQWNEAEGKLIANFRQLPAEERLKAFRAIQHQVDEVSATWMEQLEAISIVGTRYGEGDVVQRTVYGDSGVVSKTVEGEERETPEDVL